MYYDQLMSARHTLISYHKRTTHRLVLAKLAKHLVLVTFNLTLRTCSMTQMRVHGNNTPIIKVTFQNVERQICITLHVD